MIKILLLTFKPSNIAERVEITLSHSGYDQTSHKFQVIKQTYIRLQNTTKRPITPKSTPSQTQQVSKPSKCELPIISIVSHSDHPILNLDIRASLKSSYSKLQILILGLFTQDSNLGHLFQIKAQELRIILPNQL